MTTAFVLAGGGSIGAVQVGMLRELLAHGVAPDLVVGSSAGAINGAYLAGAPHSITLLIAHQLVADLERSSAQAEIVTVPPLCPLAVSPYDFSRAGELIERAAEQTRRWLQRGGLEKRRIPGALRPHED
jgi:patatin-like phospholipase